MNRKERQEAKTGRYRELAEKAMTQTHKHDEQSDSANSEFTGDGPEEYEEPDACKGIFDSLCTLVCRFVLPYEF